MMAPLTDAAPTSWARKNQNVGDIRIEIVHENNAERVYLCRGAAVTRRET